MSAARPRLVVAGCGFAGYSLLRALPRDRFDVTLVTPRNYFLFTPLLASTVTGTIEFRSIVEPARRRLRHLRVLEGEALEVDWPARRLGCRSAISGEPFGLDFDELVVAVGARAADYGVPGVREHALKLADLDDARAIRRRILECFALAALPGRSDAEIADRLRFVVCGGGPTGVEIAAEIHDELEAELARSFPGLAERARVVLIEAGARLLGGFDEALSGYTAKHFRREGIELRFDSPVARVERDILWFRDGSALACGLLVWAAGTEPSPLTRALDAPLDARGRIVTDATFRVAGRPGLWALGDCAAVGDPPLPATAQVAQQQGAHLAKLLVAQRAGRPLEPFRFRSFGMLAYIGGHQALADLPAVKWSGRGAFLFWRSVYLTKLVSLANKTKVLFDWIKTTLFGRDLSRF